MDRQGCAAWITIINPRMLKSRANDFRWLRLAAAVAIVLWLASHAGFDNDRASFLRHRPRAARGGARTVVRRQPREGLELAQADREPRHRPRSSARQGDVLVLCRRIPRRRRSFLREYRRTARVPQPASARRPRPGMRRLRADAEWTRLVLRLPAGARRHRLARARPRAAGATRTGGARLRRDGGRAAGRLPRAQLESPARPGSLARPALAEAQAGAAPISSMPSACSSAHTCASCSSWSSRRAACWRRRGCLR